MRISDWSSDVCSSDLLSLATLVLRVLDRRSRWRTPAVVLSMLGLALFYGDGLITPAISVLSAVEGLHIATPLFEPYVVPIALAILVALFAIQSHGTAKEIGRASCRERVCQYV